MLMLMWFVVTLFNKTGPAQAQEIHQPNPVITAAIGDNVTLHCIVPEAFHYDLFVWYKQKAGRELFLVVQVRKGGDPFYYGKLQSPKVNINTEKGSCNLTIITVEKEDEGMYYCGLTTFYTVFGKGTFLSLKDNDKLKSSEDMSKEMTFVNATTLHQAKASDAGMIILGAALGVCVVLISAQAIFIWKWKNSEKHTAQRTQQGVMKSTGKTISQSRESLELNYAALQFNGKKTKKARTKHDRLQDSVYSEVKVQNT